MKKMLMTLAFLSLITQAWAQPAAWSVKAGQGFFTVKQSPQQQTAEFLQPQEAVSPLKAESKSKAVATAQGTMYTYALTNKRVNERGMTANCGLADTVYVDNDKVYFRNLINDGSDGSYIQGTLTSGDINNGTITFVNGDEYANGCHVYIGTVDATGHLVPNRDATSFTFTIKNGIIKSVAPEETNGHAYLMGYTTAGGLRGYNIDYVFEPVPTDVQNVTIPSYVYLDAYEGVCVPVAQSDSSRLMAKIGIDGNDVYIKNIIPGLGIAALHGTIEDSKIALDVQKYIGKYEDIYISFYAGQITTDASGKTQLTPVDTDKMYLDYNEETGQITCNDVMVFLAGHTTLGGYWNKPVLSLYENNPVSVPGTAKTQRYFMTSRNLPDNDTDRSSREAWVSRDKNKFYFRALYTPKTELAFKGTLEADGKTISVKIPQYMGSGKWDDAIFLAAANHDLQSTIPPSATYSYDDMTGVVQFTYDEQSGTISYDGNLCTVIYGENIPITGVDTPIWTIQNDTVAIIPETATRKNYVFKTKRLRDYSRTADMYIPSYLATVAHDGDTYYLQGLNEEFTKPTNNAVLVGKRSGNQISFNMPQMINNKGKNLIYAYVANYTNESTLKSPVSIIS